ncbi:MAG TPA: group III truncated hemoglobin [Nitratifractor sp.]|nr:group III truncated hemoglobin [Nitratifractor sp.]HHH20941.1 group III truncated hemoglobin [Nitratifractor sp.]
MKYNTINQESIAVLVKTFYPTILADKIVSPFFIEKLGDDINSPIWQEHLELLSNFWSSMALGDGDYNGNPLAAHFGMDLTKEAFAQWLHLFAVAIDRVYEPRVGDFFKERSQIIARNFMANLGVLK